MLYNVRKISIQVVKMMNFTAWEHGNYLKTAITRKTCSKKDTYKNILTWIVVEN